MASKNGYIFIYEYIMINSSAAQLFVIDLRHSGLFLCPFIHRSNIFTKIMNNMKTEEDKCHHKMKHAPNCHVWLVDILKSRLRLNVLLSSSFFFFPLSETVIYTHNMLHNSSLVC